MDIGDGNQKVNQRCERDLLAASLYYQAGHVVSCTVITCDTCITICAQVKMSELERV